MPSGFAAKPYPAVERHGFIWMWMGEKAADPSLSPDFHENSDPAWAGVPGYLNIACNFQLMVDNLLDLTHVVFVHKTTLAGGGVTDAPHGGRPIEFEKGKSAIAVPSKDKLSSVIDTLIAAARAGELDYILANASKQRPIAKGKKAA